MSPASSRRSAVVDNYRHSKSKEKQRLPYKQLSDIINSFIVMRQSAEITWKKSLLQQSK